ncbi:MAG: DUF3303 domain-containing protein [Chthoniobacterales bacterium]
MWGDLMDLEIVPVLDDQELSTALQNAQNSRCDGAPGANLVSSTVVRGGRSGSAGRYFRARLRADGRGRT